MRTMLVVVSVCAVAFLHGCRHSEQGAADRGGETLVDDARARNGSRDFDRSRTSRSEAERRGDGSWDDFGVTGRRRRYDPGDELDDLAEDSPEERRRDRRSRPLRTLSDDELLVSLEAQRLPDGLYEVDQSRLRSGRMTEEEFEELLERVNARSSWIKVIRVGPWRIQVVRDTFFDPYRRDSGWIDIDELDGPHGR